MWEHGWWRRRRQKLAGAARTAAGRDKDTSVPVLAISDILSVAQLRPVICRVLSRDLSQLPPSWEWRTAAAFPRRHVESGTPAALSAPCPPGVPGLCRGAAPPLPPGTTGGMAVILLSHRPTLLLSPGPAPNSPSPPHSISRHHLGQSRLLPFSCSAATPVSRVTQPGTAGDSRAGQGAVPGAAVPLSAARQQHHRTAQPGLRQCGVRGNGEKSWDRALFISFTPITFSYVFRQFVSFIYKNYVITFKPYRSLLRVSYIPVYNRVDRNEVD